MKLFIIISYFMIIALPLFAQDSLKKTSTNIEQMSEKQGIVLKREFRKIGSSSGIEVELITISEVNKISSEIKGLKFSSYSSTGTKSSFVDANEINGIITFIEFAKGLDSAPSYYTEYNFTTKGDFRATVYSDGDLRGKLNGQWKIVVYTDKSYGSSAMGISKKNLQEFYDILIQGRQLLN